MLRHPRLSVQLEHGMSYQAVVLGLLTLREILQEEDSDFHIRA
jgi:hypothetical protein